MFATSPASRVHGLATPVEQTTRAPSMERSTMERSTSVSAAASVPSPPLFYDQARTRAEQTIARIRQADTEAKEILGTGLMHMWSRDEWTRHADEFIAQLPTGTHTAGLIFIKLPCAIVESIANIGGFIGLFFSGMERYRQEAAGAYAKEISNRIVHNKNSSLLLEFKQSRWKSLHRSFLLKREMFYFVGQSHLFRQTEMIFEENYPR